MPYRCCFFCFSFFSCGSNQAVGTGFDSKQMVSWRKGAIKGRHEQNGKDCLWLKIRNNNQIVSGFTVMMELTGSRNRGQ
jgi:N6-adenosine-specific RNA methylase IME4